MKVGDGQAEARRWLKATGRSVHSDSRGRERVIRGEDQSSPVLAAMIRCVFGTGDDIVPFENIGFRGVCLDVWWRVLGDSLVLASQPLLCGSTGSHGC